jgi:hypothetical protein
MNSPQSENEDTLKKLSALIGELDTVVKEYRTLRSTGNSERILWRCADDDNLHLKTDTFCQALYFITLGFQDARVVEERGGTAIVGDLRNLSGPLGLLTMIEEVAKLNERFHDESAAFKALVEADGDRSRLRLPALGAVAADMLNASAVIEQMIRMFLAEVFGECRAMDKAAVALKLGWAEVSVDKNFILALPAMPDAS